MALYFLANRDDSRVYPQSGKKGPLHKLTNWSAFLIFLLVFGLVIILSSGWPPGIPVTLNILRLEIVTDKEEYRLGETINATFYIVNHLPFPVRVPSYSRVDVEGYSEGELPKTGVGIHVTPVATNIYIPARSKHKIDEYPFKPTLEGKFNIKVEIEGPNIKGFTSLTVIVTG